MGGTSFLPYKPYNHGVVYVEDTSNADMTVGLTINQGAADDDAFAIKSSDIAHGITSDAETDTFYRIKKLSGTAGGALVIGYTETDRGVEVESRITNDNTDKTTAAVGAIVLRSDKKSGTTTGAMGANANIVTVSAAGTTRFILDNEGSAHADVEWITYDSEDDLTAIRDLEALMLPGAFGEALQYRRTDFERLGIIGKDSWHQENGRQHAMINWTRLAMLHHGALIQASVKIEEQASKLAALEAVIEGNKELPT